MNMSASQARVIDPILSNHARGYTQGGFIGGRLLPVVTMPTRQAKRIEFDRASFKRYKIVRAPGGAIPQIAVGYEGKPVGLIQRALAASTPVEHMEEAAEVPGIDLLTENVDAVLAVIALEKEITQAQAARNAASYANSNKLALAGDDKWSDPDSDPLTQVEDAKEVVRKRTGRRPNVLAIGAAPASAAKKHPKIREHFKHTTSQTITHEMLRAYFEVEELLVGDAIVDDNDGNSSDVWGGDAILAYVPKQGAGMKVPAFGYTYSLKGHPFVQPAYFERGVRSWLNDVFDEWSPEIVGADAGFLFQGAA